MLSPHLTSIIAQQKITELQRAAAHHRVVHTTRDARWPDTEVGRVFLRRRRSRRTAAQPAAR